MSIETLQMWVIVYYVVGIFVTAAIMAVSRQPFTDFEDFEIAVASLLHPIYTVIVCFAIPLLFIQLYITALRNLRKPKQ